MNRSLTVTFSNIERVNDSFSRCKIYVAYHGENRNNDYIPKSVFEDAIKTIYNIPIVGEFLEEVENFGDHGGEIAIVNGEQVFKHTTKPIGLVPESAKVYWEKIFEKNEEREYLVVDDALLWTGRYPEAKLIKKYKFGQSMEIEVLDGGFEQINGRRLFCIKKFNFSALCVLGISKESDPNGHVEPCFESASIIAYELNKDKFKKEFAELINQLKACNLIEGGDYKKDDVSLTDYQKNKSVHFKDGGKKVDYKLTNGQLIDEISKKISEIQTVVDYGGDLFEVTRFCYIDSDDEFVYAYDLKDEIYVKIPYTVEGDNVTLDFDSATRVKPSWSDWEGSDDVKYSLSKNLGVKISEGIKKYKEEREELLNKLEERDEMILSLNGQYAELEKKLDEKEDKINELTNKYTETLQELRKQKIEALLNKYAIELKEFTDEEVERLKESASSYSDISEFEDKIKSILFDRVKNKLKNHSKNTITMGIPQQGEHVKKTFSLWEELKNKLN